MVLRLKLTAIYMCMIVLGAFVMLLVMTFNAGILFTVVLGQTVGYTVMPKPTPINNALIHSVVQETNVYKPEYEKCCTATYEM